MFFPFLAARYECLVLGQQEYAVAYRDKLYLLFNEEAREKFLRFVSNVLSSSRLIRRRHSL